jgi:hypothetical protein
MKKTVLQIIILIILAAFLADYYGQHSNPEEWKIHSRFFAGYLGDMTPIFLMFIIPALIFGFFSLIKKLSTGKWWKYMWHFTWGIFLITQIIEVYGAYKQSIDRETEEPPKEVLKETPKQSETKKKSKYDDLFEQAVQKLDSIAKAQNKPLKEWNLISKDGIKINIPKNWSHRFQEDSAGLFKQINCFNIKTYDFFSIAYTELDTSPQDQLYYSIESLKQSEAYKHTSFSPIKMGTFMGEECYETSLKGSFLERSFSGKMISFKIKNKLFSISSIGSNDYVETIAPKIFNNLNINK